MHHILKSGAIYKLPHIEQNKNLKTQMKLEYVETKNKDVFPDGFFVSFDSQNNHSGSGKHLKHKLHFEFCESELTTSNMQQDLFMI